MLAVEEWWRRFSYFCPCWLGRGGVVGFRYFCPCWTGRGVGGGLAISAHAGWGGVDRVRVRGSHCNCLSWREMRRRDPNKTTAENFRPLPIYSLYVWASPNNLQKLKDDIEGLPSYPNSLIFINSASVCMYHPHNLHCCRSCQCTYKKNPSESHTGTQRN